MPGFETVALALTQNLEKIKDIMWMGKSLICTIKLFLHITIRFWSSYMGLIVAIKMRYEDNDNSRHALQDVEKLRSHNCDSKNMPVGVGS